MQQLMQSVSSVGLSHFLILSVVLFAIGTFGVFIRRNALVTLMSVELILNGANLALIAFSRAQQDMRGQAIALLVTAVAAAEAAIGLAIVVGVFRNRQSTNLDELTLLRY
ncbi:MAG: NADH-quinone oxidoreductase subunit NuoK [Polyangia bacterium]